jgi:hypothetical protein
MGHEEALVPPPAQLLGQGSGGLQVPLQGWTKESQAHRTSIRKNHLIETHGRPREINYNLCYANVRFNTLL